MSHSHSPVTAVDRSYNIYNMYRFFVFSYLLPFATVILSIKAYLLTYLLFDVVDYADHSISFLAHNKHFVLYRIRIVTIMIFTALFSVRLR